MLHDNARGLNYIFCSNFYEIIMITKSIHFTIDALSFFTVLIDKTDNGIIFLKNLEETI